MKILMAGFQHETNTYSPIVAEYGDFVKPDLWPGMTFGLEIFKKIESMNLPSSGFLASARREDDELVPVVWCSAEPSGTVKDNAFEKIKDVILQGIHDCKDFDALYLELHGAMVCDSYEDAEGELLFHIRKVLPDNIPVVVSLDLHANISSSMVELADVISVYRTYPHIDMFETGERAYQYLKKWLSGNLRFKSFRQIPYLIPLSSQCTNEEPNKGLYERLSGYSDKDIVAEIALGFPPSDIFDSGPSVITYANSQQLANDASCALYNAFMEAENIYCDDLISSEEAIEIARLKSTNAPVTFADVQDNSGAGATCDTIGILLKLIKNNMKFAVVGALCDPDLVSKAQSLGEGKTFSSFIGNYYNYDSENLEATWMIEKLSDGRFTCTGRMYRGSEADVGPLALLRFKDEITDILVVVSSTRFQCVDKSIFQHLGVDVEKFNVVVVKSTVHFMDEFCPISEKVLKVESPGGHPCRLGNLKYQKLRLGMRLGPMGPTHR